MRVDMCWPPCVDTLAQQHPCKASLAWPVQTALGGWERQNRGRQIGLWANRPSGANLSSPFIPLLFYLGEGESIFLSLGCATASSNPKRDMGQAGQF